MTGYRKPGCDLPLLDVPAWGLAMNRSPLVALLCLVLLVGSSSAQTEVAITRVTVVDVERGRLVPDRTVLLRSGRIATVEPSDRARIAAGVRTLDGRGKFLMPGLLDMHVHLTGSGKATEIEMPLFIAHGVTGVRVMSADRPSATPTETPGLAAHKAWQRDVEAGTLVGPRLLSLASWAVNGGAGMPTTMPPFYRASTREEGQQLARYFKERGFDFVKVYNNISRDGFFGLAEEARKLDLGFAGHEPARVSAIEISNAGQGSLEHSRIFLFNCFAGADSLQRGLLRIPQTALRRRMIDEYDAARCAEVFRTFAKNRTYLTPTHGTRKMDAFAHDSAYRNDARMKYVPLTAQMGWNADANGMVAADPSPEGRKSYLDFYHRGRELTNDAYRAGVPIMVGTDAGDSFVFPGSSMHSELDELVLAGLSPAEALKAATLGGAEYLERTADLGTVQPGRYADLVLLDADPLANVANVRRIHAVVMNGRVFERAAIDSMLTQVEEAARPSPQLRLWAGAATGDTAAMAAGLAAGASIDSLDTQTASSGRRALNYAALGNRTAAVKFLLSRGASINLANRTGFTPLHHAVEGGATESLDLLIEAGADLSLAT
ncbi:MAG: amidohydrolase family protein, partial [Gemmatimonadales bacterium]